MNFEWDEVKAIANFRKHQVSFEEGTTVFTDPLSFTIPDPLHSQDENRYIDIGRSSEGNLLVVVYTEEESTIRLISCRPATRAERRTYEEAYR
jgi:uncharacterized DUF497 family protein